MDAEDSETLEGEKKLFRLFKKCRTLGDASELYRRTRHVSFAYRLFSDRIKEISTSNLARKEDVELSSAVLKPSEWYNLSAITTRHSRKYGVWAGNFKIEIKQLPIYGVDSVIPVLLALLEDIFRNLRSYVPKQDDLVSVSLESSQLSHPIQLKLSHADDVNAEMFLYLIANVLTSKTEFTLNLPVFINLIRIPHSPTGKGNNSRGWQTVQRFAGVYVVRNNDSLCFGRALSIAIAHTEGLPKSDCKMWRRLCDGRYLVQKIEAQKLYQTAGIPYGPVSYEHYDAFQKSLQPKYQLIIYKNPHPDQGVLYKAAGGNKPLYLLLHQYHYSAITNLRRFFGKRRECPQCQKFLNCSFTDHRCEVACFVCRRVDCIPQQGSRIHCPDCECTFANPECFAYHKDVKKKDDLTECELRFKCSECGAVVLSERPRSAILNGEHQCGEYYCRSCKLTVEHNHRCYVQQYTESPKLERPFLYCDFEADISTSQHIPIAAVAVDDAGRATKFFSWNAGTKFCRWLFTPKHKNYIVIFHNLMGYDGNFIMQYLQKQGIWPNVIMRGLKFLQIFVPQYKITLRDSLAFLPMSLSAMPKAFGFPGAKGRFPFLFSSQARFNYVGAVPAENYYMISQMGVEEYREFKEWHTEEVKTNPQWSFYKEILKYCENDCQVLREACQRFCADMKALTGFNPLLESVSLPSFVNLVYRACFMPKHSMQFFTADDLQTSRTYSFESLEWLHYLATTRHCSIQHARNHPDGEKRIGRYLVDGYIAALNEVLEYHGCYFHGCPSCFARNAHTYGGQSMTQLYERTLRKRKFLEDRGFHYTCIWSCEWYHLRKQPATQQSMQNFKHHHPMNIRDALFGGRTEAFRLLVQADVVQNEYISYLDKNSLYPAVCKQQEYPLGLPVKLFPASTCLDDYFGIAHVRILAPANLSLPVLPQRIKNKCMFVLCVVCATKALNNQYKICEHSDQERSFDGVYTTPELNLALSLGYRIIKIYEVWHYPVRGDLFSKYINVFMAEKVAASGYPKYCVTGEEKEFYLTQLAVRDQVIVDPQKIENNPTRRLLSKLMLNTLWGKLAIRENRPKFEYVEDTERFNELFYSGKYNISYVDIVTEDVLQVQSTTTCDLDSSDINANVIVASFVTSYARIELYRAMAFVRIERLLYVDTDCVIALEGPGLPSLPVGECLGDFKSEIAGDQIILFVCGGPKMYAYYTRGGHAAFKAKGITINQGNIELFTPETLKEMVQNPQKLHQILNPYKIFRVKGSWEVETHPQSKTLRFTFDKRMVIDSDGYRTVPFGYRHDI